MLFETNSELSSAHAVVKVKIVQLGLKKILQTFCSTQACGVAN